MDKKTCFFPIIHNLFLSIDYSENKGIMQAMPDKTKYESVIGLEVHAELNTKTKMFCTSLNDPLEHHPNINICPVCMGHPGTLPVINREAVLKVIRVGLALGGSISSFSQFDRKNYFYPDLPKGYQISQYQHPIVLGGMLNGVRITRVHLEEDAAKLIHEPSPDHVSGGGGVGSDVKSERKRTLVDYNRAGVPLMELVTEPDLRFAADARLFAEELRMLLRYVNASDADMEKGQMRIEANISIRPIDTIEFGTKVEVKNINSFHAVEKTIIYEIQRQQEMLERGEEVKQETRGWDDVKEITISQRLKESAHDYRYFPEPDLPPLHLTKEEGFDIDAQKAEIPELPAAKRERFTKEYGLSKKMVTFFVEDRAFAAFYEEASSELKEWMGGDENGFKKTSVILGNYLTSDLQNLLTQKSADVSNMRITPENMAELIKMIYNNEISSRAAKDILAQMFADGSDPSIIVQEGGLKQVSNADALEVTVKKIIEENPKPAEDYKAGKEVALQVLVGKVMKETKGAANPKVVREILIRLL